MNRRWLITGAGGMVGSDVRELLTSRNADVTTASRSDLDVTNRDHVMAFVDALQPDVIVNCAAYTRVDDAEAHETDAAAVNATAVSNLADAANATGAALVHLSTDFVFDGASRIPYEPSDTTNPLSAYGRTKLLGEQEASRAQRHAIIRTSWLFGIHGNNFVEAIRNQIRKGTNPLRVVDDQHGRPTYTPHLAEAILRLGELTVSREEGLGIVHYADSGTCSWYDFAVAIAQESGSTVALERVTSAQFPRPAVRPAYSVLSTTRYEELTGEMPPPWRDGLREYLRLR